MSSSKGDFVVGKRIKYTAAACAGKMSPERAAQARGLCVSIEAPIAWVIWDRATAAIWEIVADLEAAED